MGTNSARAGEEDSKNKAIPSRTLIFLNMTTPGFEEGFNIYQNPLQRNLRSDIDFPSEKGHSMGNMNLSRKLKRAWLFLLRLQREMGYDDAMGMAAQIAFMP